MPDGELKVRVTPRSHQNRVDVTEGLVRVWVSASPTDGQANDAVQKLLAKALGLAPSKLTLVRGDTSREKTFRIVGLSQAEAILKLTSSEA